MFGGIGLRDIMCFQFDKHIRAKGFKSCKVSAMKLLNNFISRNPNIAIDQIVSFEWESYIKYEIVERRWSDTRIWNMEMFTKDNIN